jgi:ectoine hydroxylase-related dioxygenase (phytanoyl-CoA dioxygenase family)
MNASHLGSTYWRDGFQCGIPVLGVEEIASFRARLEIAEATERARRDGVWKDRDFYPWKGQAHPLEDWFMELAQHPAVLRGVQKVLGPDLLVRNADVFIKEPGVRRDIGWHTDTAMRTPDVGGYLTAWIGLTPSTRGNGGLHFAVGSHRAEIPNPPKDKWNLTFSGEALEAVQGMEQVVSTMAAGEMSLHHALTAHRSGPNLTGDRRIAFVVRYLSPRISKETAESGTAVLVSGEDRHGHFQLVPRFPVTWTPQVP